MTALTKYRQQFIDAMDDDLNTADAISAVFELIKAINTYTKDGTSKEFGEKALLLLDELTDVLGLLKDKEEAHRSGDRAADCRAAAGPQGQKLRSFRRDQGSAEGKGHRP